MINQTADPNVSVFNDFGNKHIHSPKKVNPILMKGQVNLNLKVDKRCQI